MGIMVQTEFLGNISPHLRLAIFHLIKDGDEKGEQVIDTGLNNILFASAKDMENGKDIACTWKKSGGCVLVGPIRKMSKEIKVRCEGW